LFAPRTSRSLESIEEAQGDMTSLARALAICLLLAAGVEAQELEPRAFSPSPIGTTFVLGGFGKSEGGILFDPALDIDNVQADLWIATVGVGHTFGLAGRQARILAVFPTAWGAVAGDVHAQPQRQELAGLVDPRFKFSVGVIGAPALTLAQFATARRRTAVGVGVTVVPPWGQYSSRQLVNLGYNRWAVKPEIGFSHPIHRLTLDTSVGVWLFSPNHSYYPAHAVKRQDAVVALQGHASYSLPRRSWVAVNATWFAGGETRVDGVPNPDLQRNTRIGVTLSIPIVGQHSIKLAYSTGTTTRRGSDLNTFNATWQLVMW
jgi:hypothetical protein